MVGDAYAAHKALVDDPASALHPDIRGRMLAAKAFSAADHIRALEQRQQRYRRISLSAMDRLDAIVLPSTFTTAIPLTEVDESVTPAFHTRFVNHLALAALSLPIGLSPSGLPTSLQIVVRRFDDPLALRIGRAFETVARRVSARRLPDARTDKGRRGVPRRPCLQIECATITRSDRPSSSTWRFP